MTIGTRPVARNIEIKARLTEPDMIRSRVAALTSAPFELLHQIDTFFDVPHGRLKVREFADGSGELIAYHRPNQTGPKESSYTRCPCENAALLVDTLKGVLAVTRTVVKRREVFLLGRTRVHLDDVERLGNFLELEVVLADGEPAENGRREAEELLRTLNIDSSALVAHAYVDLLKQLGRV